MPVGRNTILVSQALPQIDHQLPSSFILIVKSFSHITKDATNM